MRLVKIVAIAMLLTGCTGSAEIAPHTTNELAGTYVSRQSDANNYLLLSSDGRGAIVSEKYTGEFDMLMTFDWKVDGKTFYQTRVSWTVDGKVSNRSHDDSTTYKYDGHVLETRIVKTGEWTRWEPANTDVFDKLTEGVSAKFSQSSRN